MAFLSFHAGILNPTELGGWAISYYMKIMGVLTQRALVRSMQRSSKADNYTKSAFVRTKTTFHDIGTSSSVEKIGKSRFGIRFMVTQKKDTWILVQRIRWRELLHILTTRSMHGPVDCGLAGLPTQIPGIAGSCDVLFLWESGRSSCGPMWRNAELYFL